MWRGDDGFRALVDGVEGRLEAEHLRVGAPRELCRGGGRLLVRSPLARLRPAAGDLAERRQVEADAEMRALRGHDHSPYLLVRGELGHRGAELGKERHVHRVALLRAIEEKRGDVALALDGEHFVVAWHDRDGISATLPIRVPIATMAGYELGR